jgi:carboxylesterase
MNQPISHIMPGGESFFFRGNKNGILCIHGFMASPSEIRWLGKYLADKGCTVYGPRLPGHATDYHDMDHQRWQDWYATVEDALSLLRAQCERVFVVGHSMGGMLGLLLAANAQIDGLAALATPVIFLSRGMASAHWTKWLRPYTDQSDTGPLVQTIRDEQAKRGESVVGRVRHNLWSTAAVGEIYALSLAVQDRLPDVKTPLLLIYSEADKTVGLNNRDMILSHVKSETIEQHTLKNSDHILPQDFERETVFELVADFISRQSNPSP